MGFYWRLGICSCSGFALLRDKEHLGLLIQSSPRDGLNGPRVLGTHMLGVLECRTILEHLHD